MNDCIACVRDRIVSIDPQWADFGIVDNDGVVHKGPDGPHTYRFDSKCDLAHHFIQE